MPKGRGSVLLVSAYKDTTVQAATQPTIISCISSWEKKWNRNHSNLETAIQGPELCSADLSQSAPAGQGTRILFLVWYIKAGSPPAGSSLAQCVTAIPVFLLGMWSSRVHSTVLSRNEVQRGFVLLSFTVPCETGVLVLVWGFLTGWSNGVYVLHPCWMYRGPGKSETDSLKQQAPWSCSLHSPNHVCCSPYS